MAVLVGLGVLVFAALLVFGLVMLTAMKGSVLSLSTPAMWPTITLVPSSTPPPTWTPTRAPIPTPTPDLVAEVSLYLDELTPLLDDNQQLWEAWDRWYGGGLSIAYCRSHGATVKSGYRALEAQQAELNSSIAQLVPPKPLKHAHSLIVSSVRHELDGHFHNFEGCMQGQQQWFTAANIDFERSDEEWTLAMDEIRDVLAELDIDRGRELPQASEVEV